MLPLYAKVNGALGNYSGTLEVVGKNWMALTKEDQWDVQRAINQRVTKEDGKQAFELLCTLLPCGTLSEIFRRFLTHEYREAWLEDCKDELKAANAEFNP